MTPELVGDVEQIHPGDVVREPGSPRLSVAVQRVALRLLPALAMVLTSCDAAASTGACARSDRVAAAQQRLEAAVVELGRILKEASSLCDGQGLEIWGAQVRAERWAADFEPETLQALQEARRQWPAALGDFEVKLRAQERTIRDAESAVKAAQEEVAIIPDPARSK